MDKFNVKLDEDIEFASVGAVSRDTVDSWLRTADIGQYVIRDSLTREGLSLSVKSDSNVIRHFKIKHISSCWFIKRSEVFPSLPELILHYKNIGLLTYAYVREDSITTHKDVGNNWLTDLSTITNSKLIGAGKFSKVYRATWNKTTPVAVKKINKKNKDEEVVRKMMREVDNMKQLRHPHLVNFLGVCDTKRAILIITELIHKGDLYTYLRNQTRRVAVNTLIDYSRQISCGMQYLEECRYIHRDLAARNILVDDDNMVKISDFGLAVFTKQEYYHLSETSLPFKWSSPEVLNHQPVTSKSDVWSYGILLHEVFSYCQEEPYEGMTYMEVLDFIQQNRILNKPEDCPVPVYEIMKKCLLYNPRNRPCFAEITSQITNAYMNAVCHQNSKQLSLNQKVLNDTETVEEKNETDQDKHSENTLHRVKNKWSRLSGFRKSRKKAKKSKHREDTNNGISMNDKDEHNIPTDHLTNRTSISNVDAESNIHVRYRIDSKINKDRRLIHPNVIDNRSLNTEDSYSRSREHVNRYNRRHVVCDRKVITATLV